MTSHWKSGSELREYVDGRLAEEAATSRTHHLAECDDCREELARFHDGFLEPLDAEEQTQYESHAAGSGKDLMASITRQIAQEGQKPDPEPPGFVDRFLAIFRMPRLAWNLAWAVPAVVAAVFLLQPEPQPSGRVELDQIYAEVGSDFPLWTGAPGRLIHSFREPPAEPMRAASPTRSADGEIQRREDELLQLDLPRADEDAERSTAVAMLRLARGEHASAWQILRETSAEHHTPESLSALACTALLTPSEGRLRHAAEAIEASQWAGDERLRYNLVLLWLELDEQDRARDVLVSLGRDLAADDPWLAQLSELFR